MRLELLSLQPTPIKLEVQNGLMIQEKSYGKFYRNSRSTVY